MGATKTPPALLWDTEPSALALGVARILKHVATYAKDGRKCVQKADRVRLGDALFLRAWPIWRALSTIDRDSRAAARRARAKSYDNIARSAKRLKRELLGERGPKYVAMRTAPRFRTASDFNAFLAGLDLVTESAEDLAQLCVQFGRDSRTPKEQFVRDILPEIFERCFEQRASKFIDGSYNHFASAVLKEMGEEVSSEFVHRARYRKPRRKMQRR
jgi:hypothetical protein